MIIENENSIRLTSFLVVFTFMALWEVISPRRRLTTSKPKRWLTNIGIVIINTLAVRILVPVAAVGTAIVAGEKGWGILNALDWPTQLAAPLAIIALDFIIYLQHVMFHTIPLFWRMHMVHHADLDMDVTTGSRFHPIEIILSMGVKLASVVLIGAPPVAVVVFEVLLNATAMFNHSNVKISKKIDHLLRWIIVTPDMHLIHHSVEIHETNSNFGFNLPWWDRLFGTYISEPKKGSLGMTIGLDQFRDPIRLSLFNILLLPFIGKTGNYAFKKDV